MKLPLFLVSFLVLSGLILGFVGPVNAASNTILINEVLYDPTGTDQGYEWIEFKNISSNPVNVGGWQIQIAGNVFTTVFVFPANTIIAPNSYLTVGETQTAAQFKINLLGFQNGGTSTDGIRLINNANIVIDTVLYDDINSANLPDDTGVSGTQFAQDLASGLTLCRETDIDLDNSSVDFIPCEDLTLGSTNAIPVKPLAIITTPHQVFVGQSVKIYGSESTSENGVISDWTWDIGGTSYDEATLTHKFSKTGDIDIKLTVTDEIGRKASASKNISVVAFDMQKYKGLQITEVFPAPKELDINKDGSPDANDEFVELSNLGSTDINLSGLQLTDESTKDLPEFTFTDITLHPKETLVVYKETTGLTLNNDEDTVYLLGPTGEVISKLSYKTTHSDLSWHQLNNSIFESEPTVGQIPQTLSKTGEAPIVEVKEFLLAKKYDMLSVLNLVNNNDQWLLKALRAIIKELQNHPQLNLQLRKLLS